MKAILEFDLPDDSEEFRAAATGMDWALLVWKLHGDLCAMYNGKAEAPVAEVLVEQLLNTINEEMDDRGLVFPT